MGRDVIRHAAAERDIFEYAVYLELRSPQASDRFLVAVERTITLLAGSPGVGAPVETGLPQLAGLRCAPVGRFKNHLLYYLSREEGIEVVRLVHGSRNIDATLADETGEQ